MERLSDEQQQNLQQTILDYTAAVLEKSLETSENSVATLVYLWEYPVRIFFPKDKTTASSYMSVSHKNTVNAFSLEPKEALKMLDYHMEWTPDNADYSNWFDEDAINFFAHLITHETIHVIQLRDMTTLTVLKENGITAKTLLSLECYPELARFQLKMTGVLKDGCWLMESIPESEDIDKKYREFFIKQCNTLLPKGTPSTYYFKAVKATSEFFIYDFYRGHPLVPEWYADVKNPQDVIAVENAEGHFPRKHYMEDPNPALTMTFEEDTKGFWISSRYMIDYMVEKLQGQEFQQQEDRSLALASLIQRYHSY